jgi:group I intron endonuclease
MTWGVYEIKNKINEKIYLGCSSNIDKRLRKHFKDLSKNRHFNIHLQNAYNKYGMDNFETNILIQFYHTYDEDQCLRFEAFWEQIKRSEDKILYNKIPCGLKNPNPKGVKKPEEFCELMSDLTKGENNPGYRHDLKKYEKQICIDYKNGLSIKQLTKKYNCSSTPIRRILKENNIKIRSRGGSIGNQYRKNKIPWNKGLTKESDERVKKISKANKDKKNSSKLDIYKDEIILNREINKLSFQKIANLLPIKVSKGYLRIYYYSIKENK